MLNDDFSLDHDRTRSQAGIRNFPRTVPRVKLLRKLSLSSTRGGRSRSWFDAWSIVTVCIVSRGVISNSDAVVTSVGDIESKASPFFPDPYSSVYLVQFLFVVGIRSEGLRLRRRSRRSLRFFPLFEERYVGYRRSRGGSARPKRQNQTRKSGRRQAMLAVAMPIPGSTVLHCGKRTHMVSLSLLACILKMNTYDGYICCGPQKVRAFHECMKVEHADDRACAPNSSKHENAAHEHLRLELHIEGPHDQYR